MRHTAVSPWPHYVPSCAEPERKPNFEGMPNMAWHRYENKGVRATWIFIMTSPVYWLQCGGYTQVRLFGPPKSTVNWPGRRREEGGSELIAHTGYPGSAGSRQLDRWRCLSAIIYFHMPNILQTVIDGWTITIKQNVRFRGRMHPEMF